MKSTRVLYACLIIILLLVSLSLRLPNLSQRPMHHDEANQAVKFATLLEQGQYRYDPADHHGPSLYYLTLPLAWLTTGTNAEDLEEWILRLIPLIFAVGSILMLFLLLDAFGPLTIFCGGLLISLSPLMVYYSRFYIQESLLCFFIVGTLASCWRYQKNPSWFWAVLSGFFVGMMHATKETWIIALFAMALALILSLWTAKRSVEKSVIGPLPPAKHLIAAIVTALLVIFLLYSSFFQNLRGPIDSILAYKNYFARAGGADWHLHPWYYYIRMLSYSKYGPGPFWSEALVLILALLGGLASFRSTILPEKMQFPARFISIYALVSALVYSLIPYKTPWNMLPFHLGFLILAGIGFQALLILAKRWPQRLLLFALFLCGLLHLGIQSQRSNTLYFADTRNPYVYAHTSSNFLRLVERVLDITAINPDGREMEIKVILNPYETWPLPWYLRRHSRVGYWQTVKDAGMLDGVPLLVTSPEFEEQLPGRIKTGYQSEYYSLRPEVLLRLYIRRDLWDSFIKTRL